MIFIDIGPIAGYPLVEHILSLRHGSGQRDYTTHNYLVSGYLGVNLPESLGPPEALKMVERAAHLNGSSR